MQAVRIHQHGGLEVLQWETCPRPVPGKGQVLVRIKAAAMNHLDLWVRGGIPKVPLPIILGSDGAGMVAEVGSQVTRFSVGDEVLVQPLTYCGVCSFCQQGLENYCHQFGILGETQDGTQAEFLVVEERNLRQKPPHLSFEEAAAFPLVAQTAYMMLVDRANIQSGETILVWGGTSGIGTMAIQIGKWKSCTVIATGGTPEKLELMRQLGADHVLNHYEEDIRAAVQEITEGHGVQVVFEHVGAVTWQTSLRCLGKGGRIVTCGATTGADVSFNLRHLFYKQQSILGSTMGNVAALDAMIDLMEEGIIKPVIDRSFPMSQIREAHQYLENKQQMGKIILYPDSD